MAKQKAAQGKKATKAKPERPIGVKAVAVSRKKPTIASKPATKPTPAAATSSPKKKPAASAPVPAPKKGQNLKATVKPVPKLKEAPAPKLIVTRKPPEKAVKATARPAAAEIPSKRDEPGKTVKAPAPALKAKPTAKPVVAKPSVAAKAAPSKPVAKKPSAPAPKPAGPRIVGNGQLAGVLQAARSVASRTTKVVEVEKERKSHLTEEELAEFRQILLDKRRELVDDMVNLEDEARRTGSDGGSGASAMPIHMADLGTDTWEQEFTLNLIEKERTIVREIDEALDRIEKKTYGTCLATGKSISKARLRVKPWAKYCIEYARKRELGLA